ncbi:replication initiation negative regulator SeqA [Shewanella marina]|uniref:replication initiation negative regulator SeqA n=1 Tax=Shewanella marina TaxID=487319 RepID=UPI00046F99EC|nr:replication initiation negative regulator SeqA [Shewanella marina]
MKYIEVDEELYRYIASKTEQIGESASDILRRLLNIESSTQVTDQSMHPDIILSQPSHEVVHFAPVESKRPVSAVAAPIQYQFNQLINEHMLEQQKGAVGRFLHLLAAIYDQNPAKFEQILQIQGRDRLYFATSKEALLKASKTANPKEIGHSNFWVTTNNSTAKKRAILIEVLEQFGCDETRAESIAEHI